MNDREKERTLVWSNEVETYLNKIPQIARDMAKKAIENRALELKLQEISLEIAKETSSKLGIIPKFSSRQNEKISEASLVILKKRKRMAPSFHQHIAGSKMRGTTVKKGDIILVYEIEETQPDGEVMVTEKTKLEFK